MIKSIVEVLGSLVQCRFLAFAPVVPKPNSLLDVRVEAEHLIVQNTDNLGRGIITEFVMSSHEKLAWHP